MVQPALAAARSVEVIEFFAAQPRDTFTLSEVSRALGVSPASMQSILRALSDGGYLVRHPRQRTYRLGPALIAVGQAASHAHPIVDCARNQMRELAVRFHTEVTASVVVGDHITVVAAEGRPTRQTVNLRVGQRLPLVPPAGALFLAWAEPSIVETWMHRRSGDAGPSIDHLQRGLESIARRGYSIGLRSAARSKLDLLFEEFARFPARLEVRDEIEQVIRELRDAWELVDIDRTAMYDVASIAVPVFGSDGAVELVITVNLAEEFAGSRLVDVAEQLFAAACLVTREAHGRVPTGVPVRDRR